MADPTRDASYALRGLNNELGELAGTPEGGRNHQLNTTAFKLARFVRSGILPRSMVVDQIWQTARAIGLSDREIRTTIDSAFKGADKKNVVAQVPELEEYKPGYQLEADGSEIGGAPPKSAETRPKEEVGWPKLWRATDLKPAEQPRFLVPQRVPRGATTVLIGEEGIGKSLWTDYVSAVLTTGRPAPDLGIHQAQSPQHVVLIVTEDNWSSDVLPRLKVAGADLDYISVVCTEDDGSGAPVFPRDLDVLREMDPPPAAIFVDAWVDTLPPGLQVKDPQQARMALHPWKELATSSDAAVVLVTHPNRLSTGSARDRYGVTSELRKKARMTLFAKRDDDTGHLLVGPEKSNSARIVEASMYQIEAVQFFDPQPDHDGTVPRLMPAGTASKSISEFIADDFEADNGVDRTDRDSAAKWLAEYLEIHSPSVRSSEIKNDARKAGITERTLQRARKDLKIVVGYEGQPPVTNWSLRAKPAFQLTAEDDPVVPPASVSVGTTDPTWIDDSFMQLRDGMPVVPPDPDWHNWEDPGTALRTAVMPAVPVVPRSDGGDVAELGLTGTNDDPAKSETDPTRWSA
jgi:hypothetical protein